MSWLNRDTATIIRNYVDDPMTYGRLLCTSKLFGHNENLEQKLQMVRGAIKQLEYELSPKRPKTSFGRFKADLYETHRYRINGYNHPRYGSKEYDLWIDETWKNLSKDEREQRRICSIQERERYTKAVANLKKPGHDDRLKTRIKSAKIIETYCIRQLPT
jgi:hypothetical protein